MKLLPLSLAVLLCASVVQASPVTYNFDGLDPGLTNLPVYGQTDANAGIWWDSVNKTNQNVIRVYAKVGDPNDKYAGCNASNGEQLISTLSGGPGYNLFNVDPDNNTRQFIFSWEGKVNEWAGYMAGIWMDGIDAYPNTATTNEVEHVVQCGVDYVSQTFRIRGVNGLNTARGSAGVPRGDNPEMIRFTLYVDLDANGGDGTISLTTKNLDTSVESQDPNLQNVGLGLNALSPNGIAYKDDPNYDYDDATKWSGWYVRSGRMSGGDVVGYTVGSHTIENLTFIPEPATLGLIGLGSLGFLKRRRRTGKEGRAKSITKSAHLLVGCLVLFSAAFVVNAAEVTYVALEDTYVEWTKNDGDVGNRDSKTYLKEQWSSPDPNINPYHGDVCKAYIKFAIPTDVLTLNSVTLQLVNDSTNDNNMDENEIWVLPNTMDDWNQTVLTWNSSVSTYGNDPNSRYFTAGTVATDPNVQVCTYGKSAATDFTLNIDVLSEYVASDNNYKITLVTAALAGNCFWEKSEDGNYYYRPKLTWNYEIPEPATLTVLVLGALGLARRRRT
jgi:hypothetical protein